MHLFTFILSNYTLVVATCSSKLDSILEPTSTRTCCWRPCSRIKPYSVLIEPEKNFSTKLTSLVMNLSIYTDYFNIKQWHQQLITRYTSKYNGPTVIHRGVRDGKQLRAKKASVGLKLLTCLASVLRVSCLLTAFTVSIKLLHCAGRA